MKTNKPVKIRESVSRRVFNVINLCVLSLVTLVCILPFVHIFALSLSENGAAITGQVGLWPVGWDLSAYKYLAGKTEFLTAARISLIRVVLGTSISMFVVILAAYPMSRDSKKFRARTAYSWYFVITMFIGGGLIPSYFVISKLGLLDTIWALVLPAAFSAWNMILLMNFFRNVPKELEEAAFLDGAGHITTLFKVYLPVSTPVLATLLLFTVIGQWNSWFDGVFYMNRPENLPLASYLSTLILNRNMNITNMTPEQLNALMAVSEKTIRSAQIFVTMLPILLVYPFLQKYFMKGIIVGSVKG